MRPSGLMVLSDKHIFLDYLPVRATVHAIRDIRATFATLFATFPAFATWRNVVNTASLHSSFTADNLPYEQIGNNEPVCIADEVPFEIPESWEWCRLVNIAEPSDNSFADGPFGSNLKREHYTENQEVRIIQLSNIGEEGWRNANVKYTTFQHAEELKRSCVNAGDIVIAKMMPAGRAIIVPNTEEHYILSSDAVKFVPHHLLSKEYLLLTINSPVYRDQVVADAHGVTRIRTSLSSLKTYLLPIPPLAEQRRIVAKYEELLPAINEYTAKEQQTQRLNKTFPDQLRKSILQYAVQGKLVPQNPDDEPASVLLDRIRAEKERLIAAGKIKRDKFESVIFRRDNSHYEKIDGVERCIDDEIPFEVPESWCWVRLATLGEIVGGGTPKTGDMDCWNNGTIPWLTPADMKYVTGKYVSNGERYITEYGLQKSSATMMPMGTVVYSSRAPIGYIAIAANPLCTNQGFKSIVPVITGLSDYLYYCLMALTPEIQSRASGTTFKEISGSEFGKTLIPLPSLAEQSRIVLRTEALLAIVTTL